MYDVLGNLLRVSPPFRGKWRLRRIWEKLLQSERRIARLPDGSRVFTQLDIPYERTVWLENEEWEELLYLQHKLRPGQCFVDIGANIGLWTLVGAASVGPDGIVVSFEPNPKTHAKLMANIELNDRQTMVIAHQAAVSGAPGKAQFLCRPQHNTSCIVEENSGHYDDGSSTVDVDVVALDSSIDPRRRVSGIKIDSEGHEQFAIEGAGAIIARDAPWIVVEFNTTLLPSCILRDWSVFKQLSTLGYRAFKYRSDGSEYSVDGSFSISGYTNILFQKSAARD